MFLLMCRTSIYFRTSVCSDKRSLFGKIVSEDDAFVGKGQFLTLAYCLHKIQYLGIILISEELSWSIGKCVGIIGDNNCVDLVIMLNMYTIINSLLLNFRSVDCMWCEVPSITATGVKEGRGGGSEGY